MSISEKTLGISRERWWFIARLYAALSVIGYLSQIAFSVLSPLTFRSSIWAEQEWGIWGSYFLYGFGHGWVYFLGGFFVVRYFRETWLQATGGILAVGAASSVIYNFIPLVGGLLASNQLGHSSAGSEPTWLLYGASVLATIVPLIFVVAGGAFLALVAEVQPTLKTLSFKGKILALYLAATSLAMLIVQTINLNLSHIFDYSFVALFVPRGYVAEAWSYTLVYAFLEAICLVPLLYWAAGLFTESWHKIMLTMLTVGSIAALLPEVVSLIVYPWYLEASISAYESTDAGSGVFGDSLRFAEDYLEQGKIAIMAEYFWKTTFPDMAQLILVLFSGLMAIVLRHFVPPGQLRPLIRRIRRWT